MSVNLTRWLEVANEEHQEAKEGKVIVQDGESPKKDFSDATNEDTGDVDTAKPATAELPAASEDAPEGKHTQPDDHLDVRTSAEAHAEAEVPKVEPDIGGGDPNDDKTPKGEAEASLTPNESGEEDTGDVENNEEQITADHQDAEPHVISNEATSDIDNLVDAEVAKDGKGTTVEKGGDATPEVDPKDEGTTVEEGGDEDDKTADKVEEASQALEEFKRMQSSLEAYRVMCDQALESSGGLMVETAQAMRIGLEWIDPSFGEGKIVPSNEAFGQTSSRKTATLQVRNGIKNALEVVEAARGNAQAQLDALKLD